MLSYFRSSVFLALAAASVARALVPDWTPPLSTRGRYVVDADGNRFKLKSGNFHGASGTWEGSGDMHTDSQSHAGENSNNLPLGLQYVPIDQILDSFEEIGINSIRLQFSNDLIHDTSIIDDSWVAANPQLKGLTPLQVYDAVVKALTDRRFAVIINNHTNKYRWCCGVGDGNERWNESQDESAWIADWVFMVSRYKDNKRVVGADLYNEVRRDYLNDPNWGLGDSHDWWYASGHAGDSILQTNSDILVIIEGINWYGLPVDGFDHGRPTLTPAGTLSHTLLQSDKLVYSAHFYAYTGPKHSGATGLGETSDPRYRDLNNTELADTYRQQASFVALDQDAHYIHPLWMSEFGIGRFGNSDKDTAWFNNTINYLISNDIDFAYWPLIGYLENGQGNGWALQNWDTTAKRDGITDGNDWRLDLWSSLVNSTNTKTGPVDVVPHWRMLTLDFEDYVKSVALQGNDWDNGARKGVCPDGLRLIGVSNGSRGLCTDAGTPGSRTWTSTETIYDERHVTSDWASGFTKYQCGDGQYAIGFALRGAKVSTVLCASSDQALGMSSTRTLWFNQSDNRGDPPKGGEFASKQYKGQCDLDEHIAGIAFTTSLFQSGAPAGILCRK